jgi:hypothetical protein
MGADKSISFHPFPILLILSKFPRHPKAFGFGLRPGG